MTRKGNKSIPEGILIFITSPAKNKTMKKYDSIIIGSGQARLLSITLA